ncbi:MAG: beta-ketoacyl-[acyl-carrier-protein] synthase family protein [Desulfurispora sp.]|uniref:beta-ketoacyl-[acyl-carrier-protein] synthase family protein n=1 Tax=Desulfurispora sp. TaxID=3014275 RepID=UPI0040498148
MAANRVVITGLGVVSAAGIGREEFWRNVVAGRTGIKILKSIDSTELRTKVAGEIQDYCPEEHFSRRQLRRLDRAGQYAVLAAREAIKQAGLEGAEIDASRAGVVLGTSLGGMQSGDCFHRQWLTRGLRRARPGLLLSYPIHTPCDAVAHHLGWRGPRSVISTACAAGANALGLARDLLLAGQADVMLAGGVDPLCLLSFTGFSVLQAACPEHCAPYSRSDGMNLGEGAAVLVLEPLERALERRAPILAEFLGYALSADAYHPTAPDPSGRGAATAMIQALQMAGLSREEVSYINGHGTGTPANDQAEPRAMRLVFGSRLSSIPISSTKSIIGHTLGAAGAIEVVTCTLAVERDVIPPTINFHAERVAYPDLDFVPNRSRAGQVEVALSNSFAFGGNNACVIVGKYRARRSIPREEPAGEVVITGLGAVGAAGNSIEEWWRVLARGQTCWGPVHGFDVSACRCQLGAEMPALSPRGIASPEAWRRMDTLSRQALVAARQAIKHAGLSVGKDNENRIAVIFATGSGPIETVEAFNRSIILQGPAAANPKLFPNTVMNAAAGHICLATGIKGPTSTITAGGVSSLQALIYAAHMLRCGRIDAALVVCADEFNQALLAGHDCLPGFLTREAVRPFDEHSSGTLLGAAGVAFVLEREELASQRGAVGLARWLGYGLAGDTHRLGGVDPRGEDWSRAITRALEQAGVQPAVLGYCAAAASGVAVVDRAEALALTAAGCAAVPVGAPKSLVGDCMGCAGAVNVLAGILALREGQLTPTAHLQEPLADLPLAHVRQPVRQEVNYVLINSFAYGGNYTSLVLGSA